jgi:rod shape determining protein RodA
MRENILTRILDRIQVDWHLFIPALVISLAGLVTMNSLSGENYFFFRQSIWILVSVIAFLLATMVDWHFLRKTKVIMSIFLGIVLVLITLLIVGGAIRGSQSWFRFGSLAFQPADAAKLVVVLILAKYFSRRHVEIKNLRHIIVSSIYALIVFLLVFLQPDFGSAVVILGIWLGMVLVSGISKKHLLAVGVLGAVSVAILWMFVFAPYQKARIITLFNPMADIRGTGYNVYQSTIAVGSGQLFGKGIGQGSQSKLKFLPEYQTDFIFAAFAEEWGVVGTTLLLIFVLLLLFRIVNNAKHVTTNFETLFGLGIAIFFSVHIAVHAGMNLGLMPVTGITFPFMSYGGSHLLVEWLAIGILSSMKKRSTGVRI